MQRCLHILAALTSFCTRVCRGYPHASSHAATQASSLIRSCSAVKSASVTGATRITGVSGTLSWVNVAATSALETMLCGRLRHITEHSLLVEKKPSSSFRFIEISFSPKSHAYCPLSSDSFLKEIHAASCYVYYSLAYLLHPLNSVMMRERHERYVLNDHMHIPHRAINRRY
jgi:hypothetical protein